MFLLDDDNQLVDSEFSFGIIDGLQCVVIESSGGANPSRGVVRRNPEYNKLLNLILARLQSAEAKITAVILDSNRVSTLPVEERIADLGSPYPINLQGQNVDELRRLIGSAVASLHCAQDSKSTGNAQRRICICVDRLVAPAQLLTAVGDPECQESVRDDYAPGLSDTEKEFIRKARLGQGLFRKTLLRSYGSTCPIVGIRNTELLVASHIKPWFACTNKERLDPHNGILLSALIDRLFDRGLITFKDDGTVCCSPDLSPGDKALCQLEGAGRLKLSPESQKYMEYHRECVWKRSGQKSD